MSQRNSAQINATLAEIENEVPRSDREALVRELDRVVFETIVAEAVELVEVWEIDPFDAADRTAAKHNYDDFQAILEAVREKVDCRGRRVR